MDKTEAISGFDMMQCKPGDKLLTSHGVILEYLGRSSSREYPHSVLYPDGSHGTRCNDGFVFANRRLPEDEDVIGFADKQAEAPHD